MTVLMGMGASLLESVTWDRSTKDTTAEAQRAQRTARVRYNRRAFDGGKIETGEESGASFEQRCGFSGARVRSAARSRDRAEWRRGDAGVCDAFRIGGGVAGVSGRANPADPAVSLCGEAISLGVGSGAEGRG